MQNLNQKLKDSPWDFKKIGYAAGGIFIGLIILIGIFVHIHNINQYDHYENVDTVQAANTKSQAYMKSNKLEFDFMYKDGCKNCESVRSGIIDNIKSLAKSNANYIIADANQGTVNRYAINNNVSETPSAIIKFHGKTVIQYTGTNVKKLNQVLSGMNPITGATIKPQAPKESILINDFTKSMTKVPFYGN